MDDLLSEKEQIDQFRAWWKEYGLYVIGGIVIGAGVLFGINQYQSSKLQAQLDGSEAYERLVVEVTGGDLEAAEEIAAEISSEYGDTAYAGQSGLAMARLYMDKNRDQDAADTLLAVIGGESEAGVKSIARLRLARIYLYQGKAQEVVDLLATDETAAFSPAYGELLGDAYTELGRIVEAQDAYQKVLLDPLTQGTIDQQLVQWKSLDLPEAEAAEAAVEESPAEPETTEAVETGESTVEESE